jgi:hypothetical protein
MDSPADPQSRLKLGLLGFGIGAFACGTWLWLGADAKPVCAAPACVPLDAAPVAAAAEPIDAPAEPAAAAAPVDAPAPLARAALEEWVAGLAEELVHEPFQPRVYQERLEGCLGCWTPEVRAELDAWLANPPLSDADFVVLASLARAQSLRLPPALASRLRPLALREDVPFGLALEAARALVAGGGVAELSAWSAALENARDPRARAIAFGALGAVHEGGSERFLIERALELGDPRAAGRLLDALGRALEGVEQPADNPARVASAARLCDVASDSHADGGLRARALGVLRCLDPQAAERVAGEWFLEPGAGPERIEFAANCLRGREGASAALRNAQADARVDDVRRARLAECVLFTPPEALAAQAREEALLQMRNVWRDSQDGAARRRSLHALARFGTDEDRVLVQQAAQSDPDPLARAAARSSMLREQSDWK